MPKVHNTPKRPNPQSRYTHAHVARLFRAWKARREWRCEPDVSFATFERELVEYDAEQREKAARRAKR